MGSVPDCLLTLAFSKSDPIPNDMNCYAVFTPSHKRPSRKSHFFRKSEGDVALLWQLRGKSRCYGVYVPLIFAKIALYPTISGRNCRSPERRRILNSPRSRAYFLLEMYPVTFWTGLGWCPSKTSDQKSSGARQ